MRIAVIGSGLQAYVASACFASVGNQVSCFARNIANYDQEPGLITLFEDQVSANRINVLDLASDIQERFDFVILAGTSFQKWFDQVSSIMANSVKNGAIFVVLTPSEVGEASKLSDEFSGRSTKAIVCSVPLLLREGRAIQDFTRPDNIIIGCDNQDSLPKVRTLFYPFNRVKDVIREVTTKEAEFSSFAGNAMLATRLSFMNEMANLAEKTGVDIDVVRECIGSDPRIGRDYLYPGCGYGGKALAENVAKVANELQSRSDDLGLLQVVAKINERQKDLLFRKIWSFFKTELQGKTIAIWGASFKPGTASIEGAPAINLIESLLAQSAHVRVFDPLALGRLKEHFANSEKLTQIHFASNSSEALENADVLAICTEWKEFWNPDFKAMAEVLKYKVVFDGRNLYHLPQLTSHGLRYFAIGKGEVI